MRQLLREALPEIVGGLTVVIILGLANIFSQAVRSDQLLLLIMSVVACTIVAAGVLWFILNSPAHMNLKWRFLVVITLYSVIIFYAGWVGTRFELLNPNRTTEGEIREVIADDIQLLEQANLSVVDTIWAPDGTIQDCGGTIDTKDDAVYVGIDEIRDRYRNMFGWQWRTMTLVDLTVRVNGDRAVVTHKGLVVNGQEFFNHPAEYTLRKLDGRWVITSLRIRCA